MKPLPERIAEREAIAKEETEDNAVNLHDVHQAAAEAAVTAADRAEGVDSAPLASREGNEGLQEAIEGSKQRPGQKKSAPFPAVKK
jgi:hypothetical protein